MFKRISVVVLILTIGLAVFESDGIAQQPTAQLIIPGSSLFNQLANQFHADIGFSGGGLASFFQTAPRGSASSMANGTTYYPLAGSSVNLGSASLLGILGIPNGSTIGGIGLPSQLGIGFLGTSVTLVLIDLNTGNIFGFVAFSNVSIVNLFFPGTLVQLLAQLIVPPTFGGFPTPVSLPCPALGTSFPINVPFGAPTLLVTVNSGSTPVFQISTGVTHQGQPALIVQSLSANLQYSLTSSAQLQFGLVFGGAAEVVIPFGIPFRLQVSGGGKSACISGSVFGFFGASLNGNVTHN